MGRETWGPVKAPLMLRNTELHQASLKSNVQVSRGFFKDFWKMQQADLWGKGKGGSLYRSHEK